MKILVWGLGYVGAVSSACLASAGHEVMGVDNDMQKVGLINAGLSPIKEPGLDTLIETMRKAGKLGATSFGDALVADFDVSIVCVGTPSDADGSLKTGAVEQVVTQIGKAIRNSNHSHLVVVRSTLPAGTLRHVLAPILERESGRTIGDGVYIVFNPEFLRESTAIADYWSPPYTIFGTLDMQELPAVQFLVSGIQAPIKWVGAEEAEVVKLVGNAFHGLKATFANEIGRLGRALNVDSSKVMQLICADTKLNISPAYLRPGFAIGGSCLPKDIRALNACAAQTGVRVPILKSLMESNMEHVREAHCTILSALKRDNDNHKPGIPARIAVLGLGFKAHTDDVRESPVLDLITMLREDGIEVVVFDPEIDIKQLTGANRNYLQAHLTDPEKSLVTQSEISGADCIVVTQKRNLYTSLIDELRESRPDIPVVDLA